MAGFSTSVMDQEKANDEVLEIEVFPDHFRIHGSYSLIINKVKVHTFITRKGSRILLGVQKNPKQQIDFSTVHCFKATGELLAKLHSNGTSSLDFTINPKLRRLLNECLQEKTHPVPGDSDLISSRAKNLLTDEDSSDAVYVEIYGNRFNADTNPQGNINFCTAENNVCADELMSQLEKKGFSPCEAHIVHYPPAGGHSSTKRAISRYTAEFMSAKVAEEELVILPSSTSAYDMLCHCVCEAGDIILTGTPTYAASVRNCGSRAECHIRPVEMNMESPVIDIADYQRALEAHHSKVCPHGHEAVCLELKLNVIFYVLKTHQKK